jgi:NAD+ kinase
VKRAAVLLHAVRPEAAEVGRWLVAELAKRGVEVQALPPDAARLGDPVDAVPDRFPEGADLLFVLGGDGTLLRAAELACEHGVPLLGVNFGHLGFLAHLEKAELASALDDLASGEFTVDERMVIEGELFVGGTEEPVWAMNDAIIQKASVGRAIKLQVAIDGERFTSLAADGIIVATPTGSTAYSFSAGGPVVSPRLDCLVVTPVAPHALFERSLVLAPEETVTVTVLPDPDQASLSLDGRAPIDLASGAEVRLHAGERRVKLARVGGRTFWGLVRDKFGLPDRPR